MPTYTAYKIFDASYAGDTHAGTSQTDKDGSITGTTDPVSYTISTDNKWFSVLFSTDANGVATPVSGQTWVTATKQSGSADIYNVSATATLNDSTGAKNFATWLNSHIPADANKTTLTSTGSGTDLKASNLAKGYYLVTSTLGSNLILATTDVEIFEKNQYPGSDKTQSTASDGTYADTAITREIGQTVYYHVDITIPATATKSITVTDKMSKGLSMQNENTAITWSATTKTGEDDPTAITTSSITGWDSLPAVWTAGTTDDDGTTYTATIPDDVVASLASKAGDSTTVTLTLAYTAVVNADAVIGDTGNPNSAHIVYDNFTTTDSTVTVKVYDFKLKKTFAGSSETDTDFSANFELRTTADDSSTAKKFTAGTNSYKLTTDAAGSTVITAKKDTSVTISGLAQGTYYLVETSTQNGYNVLTKPITVEIDADGKVSFTNQNDANPTKTEGAVSAEVTVENNKGTILPSTGGIGTTIFYVAGIALIGVAAVLLVLRRRKNA